MRRNGPDIGKLRRWRMVVGSRARRRARSRESWLLEVTGRDLQPGQLSVVSGRWQPHGRWGIADSSHLKSRSLRYSMLNIRPVGIGVLLGVSRGFFSRLGFRTYCVLDTHDGVRNGLTIVMRRTLLLLMLIYESKSVR